MSTWDELKKCGEGFAAGAASGAALDAASGGATLGAGAAVGGLWACADASDLDEMAWRGIKKGAAAAWDAVSSLWEDDAKPDALPTLEFALFRTAWSIQHTRRFVYMYGARSSRREDIRNNTAGAWKEGDPAKIWHAANRAALLGPAGVQLTAAALYRGLAIQYLRLRSQDRASSPEAVLTQAVKSFGDWLHAGAPGTIDAWLPTEGLRRAAQLTRDATAQPVAVEPAPAQGYGLRAGLLATGLLLALGATGALVWRTTR